MSELSIFVDESGDFGEYEYHSPYYIITMVFHDQRVDISSDVDRLNEILRNIKMEEHYIHTGPIIRKEKLYEYMDIKDRRRLFNKLVAFYRHVDIQYRCFSIEKKQVRDVVDASGRLSKQISAFIRDHYETFLDYDVVKVYYDNGQIELNKILSSVLNVLLQNVEFRRVMPADYKLFQVADLLCSFELIRLKMEHEGLSLSESKFFGNLRDLKKNYLKPLERKKME